MTTPVPAPDVQPEPTPPPASVVKPEDSDRSAPLAPFAPFAMHGFFILVPSEWECVINKGDWQGGYAVMAMNRQAQLNVTWQRSKRAPDLDKSLAQMARQMEKDHKAKLTHNEKSGKSGLIARFSNQDGDRHVAILQPDPQLNYTLVLRQIEPGAIGPMQELAASARTLGLSEPMPWRFSWLGGGSTQVLATRRRPSPGRSRTGSLVSSSGRWQAG